MHVLKYEQQRLAGGRLQDGLAQVLQHLEGLPAPRHLGVQESAHTPSRWTLVQVLDLGEKSLHRFEHRRERNTGLKVQAVSDGDGEAAVQGSTLDLPHQRGLADPSISTDENGARSPLCRGLQGLVQSGQLRVTADKVWHVLRSKHPGPPP